MKKAAKRIIQYTALSVAAVVVAALLIVCFSIPRPLFSEGFSATVYSAEGRLLGARIAPDGQWRFMPADSLPPKFATCLIAFEDKRFLYHRGIDPFAIARAVRINISRGGVVSGGSTITMQLARIARGNRERTVWQKGIEALWALALERGLTKDEILTIYSSHAPFGGNVIGVETAAWRYFGRPAGDLSWAESALLAVLPNSPALIHPGRNRDALRRKRDRLLATLRDRGVIDATEFELACMEELPEAPVPLPSHAPHLTDRMAAGYIGARVNTTVQDALQRRVQEIVDRHAGENASNHIYSMAAIVADVETGEVLAYAGNVGFAGDHGNSVDIITAPRSTGSILKPILYAGMMTDGMILPGTLVSDVPLNINGFMPQNFNRRFYGAVPAGRAIERSLNVPLVRMLGKYNTGRFMELLKSYGMTTLRFGEDHYGASLILGGAEGTLWDMVGMYASMARTLAHYTAYGSRYDPADIHPLTVVPRPARDSVTAATDSRESKKQRAAMTVGESVTAATDGRLKDRSPLSASSIWFAFEAMSGLNRPEEEADWQQFRSMKRVAWKTGTSFGSRDGWAIGVTPRYAVGVWVGNASGEGRAGLTGVGSAAPVLFEILSTLPGGGWFEMPYDDMTLMAVCRRSGHKASEICDDVDSLYMPAAGIVTDVCPYHRLVHLSQDGLWQVNSSCEPVGRIVSRPWFVLPPAQEYYYRNYNPDYRPLPPFRADCEQPRSRTIDIIYPEHNMALYLPTGLSGAREKFVFRAAHADPGAEIYWYVDQEFAGTTSGQHQVALEVPPGRHTLTLTDANGNMRRINFSVK